MDDETDSALNMKIESSILVRGHTSRAWLATLTTHRQRRCPYCQGDVYREKRKGFAHLSLALAVRPYRCADCDRLHYGFCF
jgi:DNA-directed RNA polymerase subunit RPC12/RpoP